MKKRDTAHQRKGILYRKEELEKFKKSYRIAQGGIR
uniref:Uncharacterized protein n=1 Tax=Nelumbo nucifera TaxID=4432 RepID=A0A822ZL35_NELNU|nr:TPA_asm: hypothetical protein HUJ06_004122 [Nelumbo nucifera]